MAEVKAKATASMYRSHDSRLSSDFDKGFAVGNRLAARGEVNRGDGVHSARSSWERRTLAPATTRSRPETARTSAEVRRSVSRDRLHSRASSARSSAATSLALESNRRGRTTTTTTTTTTTIGPGSSNPLDRRPRRPRGWEASGPAPSDRSRRGSIVKVRRRRSGAPVRREGAGRCLAAARWPPAPIDPVRAGDDRPRRRGGCLRNRPAGRSVARGAPAPDEPCRSRPPSPRTFAARRPRTLAPNPGDGDSPPGTTRTLRGRNPRGRARSGSRT